VVLKVDETEEKISLGMKQTEQDPWMVLPLKYPVGTRIAGKVRNLTSFGAFVEIEPGIDGLIHISDMSWTKRVQHPSEVVKKGDAVDVVILNIDADNKRISLGLKQAEEDPWLKIGETYPIGMELKGHVVRLMDKGVVVDCRQRHRRLRADLAARCSRPGEPGRCREGRPAGGPEGARGRPDSSPHRARGDRVPRGRVDHRAEARDPARRDVNGAENGNREQGTGGSGEPPLSFPCGKFPTVPCSPSPSRYLVTMPSARDLLDDLHHRRAAAEAGGGTARIAQQHKKGKLTARERLDLMLDHGSFAELDRFVTHRATDFGLADQSIRATAW
jgi:predicted RNA-binding protein with RPS1 domain